MTPSEQPRYETNVGTASSAAVLITPGALQLPPHSHVWDHAAIVVAGGFAEADGEGTSVCSSGTSRISPAGDRHAIEVGAEGVQCVIVGVDALNELPRVQRRVYQDTRWVNRIARRLAVTLLTEPAVQFTIESLTFEVWAQLFRVGSERFGPTPRWLTELRDNLHASPAAPPTLASLGARHGVHPLHIPRAFREHFGCTLREYHTRVRLERARVLLTHGSQPLARIALDAGFSDQSHFTHAWRRATGSTPASFRKLAQR